MDSLRKEYPEIPEVFLEHALDEANGDGVYASALLRLHIGNQENGGSAEVNAMHVDMVYP